MLNLRTKGSPDQPRDERGRFAESGATGNQVTRAINERVAAASGQTAEQVQARREAARRRMASGQGTNEEAVRTVRKPAPMNGIGGTIGRNARVNAAANRVLAARRQMLIEANRMGRS